MKLHIIFGQRHETYDGEYAPEVLDCWDESSLDENHEGFEASLEAAEGNKDFRAVRVVVVKIDGAKVGALLNQVMELDGEIDTSCPSKP